MVTGGYATQELAKAVDNITDKLGDKITELADQINELTNSSNTEDVANLEGVKDGDIIKLQYTINQMSKAAESGASTWAKGQNIEKQLSRQIMQA
jgi:hypothetical protein